MLKVNAHGIQGDAARWIRNWLAGRCQRVFINQSYCNWNANNTLLYYYYTLSGRIGKVVASNAVGCKVESRLWLSCTDLYYTRGAQALLPMRVGGATSQLDLPSLTKLSVAGYGRLQLGVPHWAASVDYCK